MKEKKDIDEINNLNNTNIIRNLKILFSYNMVNALLEGNTKSLRDDEVKKTITKKYQELFPLKNCYVLLDDFIIFIKSVP